jgi:PTS system nitrogen regulatory IIA component
MLLLAPAGAGADHLKALARVARLLRIESLVESLRATGDPRRLHVLLTAPLPSQNAA